MIQACYLVLFNNDLEDLELKTIAVIAEKSADHCAKLLGLDLCYDSECDEHMIGTSHVHIPDGVFGLPQPYPQEEFTTPGLCYRQGRLPEIGLIRWEFYREGQRQRVIHFQLSKLIV